MSAEIDALNDRQRRFAQLVVSGLPAGRAYQKAGYKVRSDHVADQAASRLLRNVKGVRDYVSQLREELYTQEAMSQAELVAFLSKAIRTPVGEIDETSPLCQEWVREERLALDDGDGEDGEGTEVQGSLFSDEEIEKATGKVPVQRVRVKIVDKLKAGQMLAGIFGWNKPQEHKHGVDDALGALIDSVRSKTA